MQPANTTVAKSLDPFSIFTPEATVPRELIWTVSGFAFFTPLLWRATSGKTLYARGHQIPHILLVSHVAVSVIELLIYYVPLYRTGAIPPPNDLFLGLCIFQSFTSLALNASTWRLPRGQHELVRATFQTMTCQRLLATGIAYHTGSLAWHKASIKLLSSFVWARFIIFHLPNYVAGLASYGSRYTAGILGGEIMGLWEGDYPYGIIMYFVMVSTLLALDRWTWEQHK